MRESLDGTFCISRSSGVTVVLLLLGMSATGHAAPVSEVQRIEHLIQSIERLPDAKFVRNGSTYDARAAADHLRLKWRSAGDRVKTAHQFIELCGSRSSVSGQPYLIRFADGRVVTSEAFLRAKLRDLDSGR